MPLGAARQVSAPSHMGLGSGLPPQHAEGSLNLSKFAQGVSHPGAHLRTHMYKIGGKRSIQLSYGDAGRDSNATLREQTTTLRCFSGFTLDAKPARLSKTTTGASTYIVQITYYF
ncbi:MAG: hypothetical protein ACJA04_001099 [Cellvibrionaceae bacterium]|jgi:hypothetical protein